VPELKTARPLFLVQRPGADANPDVVPSATFSGKRPKRRAGFSGRLGAGFSGRRRAGSQLVL
jgi:hypothetical protein